jgi:hypothetical protein
MALKAVFEMQYDDYVAALQFSAETSRQFKPWVFFWRWGAALWSAVLTAWLLYGSLGMASLLCGLGVGIVFAKITPWLLSRRILARIHETLRRPESGPFLTGKKSVEILPEGLKLEGQYGETLWRWAMIESIDRVPPYLFVKILDGRAFPIPLAAVDGERFLSEVRERIGVKPG